MDRAIRNQASAPTTILKHGPKRRRGARDDGFKIGCPPSRNFVVGSPLVIWAVLQVWLSSDWNVAGDRTTPAFPWGRHRLAAVPKSHLEASNGRAAHPEEISSLLHRAAALGR